MLTNVEEMLKACMYIRKVYVNEFYSYFKEENYSPNEIRYSFIFAQQS